MLQFGAPHDPDAVLDYHLDWSDWLAGATIVSHTVTVTGATLDSDAEAGGIVSMWISGGIADTTATVHVRVTTSDGRTDDRTARLVITER